MFCCPNSRLAPEGLLKDQSLIEKMLDGLQLLILCPEYLVLLSLPVADPDDILILVYQLIT